MSENPSIKKNIALSTMYQILTIITPFITAPYISRVLNPDGIGIYSYTQSIQMYFSMFAALGTASYGVREIARSREDVSQRSRLFWEIEGLRIFTSIVIMLIWGLFVVFSKDYKIYFLILTLNIAATMFDISWFYSGLEQFKYTVFTNTIVKIITIASIFAFVKDERDLAKYVLIISLSGLLGNMSMWMHLSKFVRIMKFSELQISRHFKETLVYFIPTIATSIYTILDKTLIGIITKDSYQNGYYEQATRIINIAKAVTFTAINDVLGSRISYLFEKKEYGEIHRRIDKSIDFIMFLGVGICFGLIGIADNFVPWFFGDGYDKVIELLCIFSPIVLIIGVSNCLGSQYYNPAGLRAVSARFIIIGSVTNLVLNLVLIPRFGSNGAAVASVIAELVITVLYMAFCDKYVTIGMLIKHGYKRLVAGALMLCAMLFVSGCVDGQLLGVLLTFASGSFVYIVVLFICKDTIVSVDNVKRMIKREKY